MKNTSYINIGIYTFLFVYFLIGLSIFQDFGIGIEEHFQRKSGFYWLNQILNITNFDNLKIAASNRYDAIMQIPNLVDIESHLNYGIIFDLPTAFIETLFDLKDDQVFKIRHLINFSIFFVSGIFFYKILDQKYKQKIITIIGLAIYLLLPKSFGSSFFDSKDLFFLSIITISFYFYVKFEGQRNIKYLCLFALFSAFSVSSRIFGLILPISFLIIGFLNYFERKSNIEIKYIFYYLIFFIFFSFLHWPYLWIAINDFSNLIENFAVRTDTKVYFEGIYINSKNLPYNYIPKLIFLGTPIFVTLFFIFGILISYQKIFKNFINIEKNNDKKLWIDSSEKTDLFLIINFSIILLHYFTSNPNLYGGWRHYIFLNFFISYFSSYGINYILTYFKNVKTKFNFLNIAYLFLILCFFHLIYKLILYHPYQSYFFNELINNQTKKNYEIDTQSLSRVDALKIIVEDSKNLNEVSIATASWTPLEDAKFQIDKDSRNRLIFLGTSNKEDASYIYSNHFYEVDININSKYKIPKNFSIYKELIIDGSKIYTIYKKN